jgi:hypothetical protein
MMNQNTLNEFFYFFSFSTFFLSSIRKPVEKELLKFNKMLLNYANIKKWIAHFLSPDYLGPVLAAIINIKINWDHTDWSITLCRQIIKY